MRLGAHWLNRDRFTVYPRIFLFLFLVIAGVWIGLSQNMVDLNGKPLGYDFISFWSASFLGLAGRPQDAYSLSLLFEVEKTAVPAMRSLYAWFYPPSFYLMVLPLALMPYLVAYLVFMAVTLGFYLTVLARIIRRVDASWCVAAFSGLWLNLVQGQNAFLTAALAGGAMLCLKRRPVVAGILIGLLAIKPHLALLFPVALAAAGAWRAFFVAGSVAAIFIGAGTAVFGVITFETWAHSLDDARLIFESGALPWAKSASVFAMSRLLGAPVMAAYVAQVVIACGAAWAVWWVWRRCPSQALRGAALMTATFLVSPFHFDYDLAWLAFPIAWMALEGLRDGWLRGEREVLVAAWILPLFMGPIAQALGVQIGPFVLIALLWMIVQRVRKWPDRVGTHSEDSTKFA